MTLFQHEQFNSCLSCHTFLLISEKLAYKLLTFVNQCIEVFFLNVILA